MEISCPWQEGLTLQPKSTLPSVYMRKKLTLLPKSRAGFLMITELAPCSDCFALTELTQLSKTKCLYGEKLAWLGGQTLPSQKGDPARWVTLLAEPTFCFSFKRFAKFCKEMYEKLACPGNLG